MKLTSMDMIIKKGTTMTLNEMYKKAEYLGREYAKVNCYIAQLEAELDVARSKAELIRKEWDLLDEDIEFAEEEGE